MVGDFNWMLNNSLDRKSKLKVNKQEGELPKSFFELIKQEIL